MSDRRTQKKSRSLADLDRLVKKAELAKKPKPQDSPLPQSKPSESEEQEGDLFEDAMADVTPMQSELYWQWPPKKSSRHAGQKNDDSEMAALKRLVEEGEGFHVADTPEYMESAGPGVDRSLIRRLHQGRFSVQGHVDLHGLTGAEAEQVLSQFIHNALVSGKRMVLVIHGRGLSSPGPPVLKNMVYTWLTRGPLRRNILAFASARSCDGGAGATYVLLRKKPWTKKK